MRFLDEWGVDEENWRMLRMHTRTVEVVEGSLIAMIDGCVRERLGEDSINGRVYMVASHSSGISHARMQTSSHAKTGCRHGYESLRCASCVIVRGTEYL